MDLNLNVQLTGTNTLSIVALSEKTVNTANWKCETSLGGSARGQLARAEQG